MDKPDKGPRITPESLLKMICDEKNYFNMFPARLILNWARTDITAAANFVAIFFAKVFRELDVTSSGLDAKRHDIRDIPSSFNHGHCSWNLQALTNFCKKLSKNPELIKQIRNNPSYPQGSQEDLYIFEGRPTDAQIAAERWREAQRIQEDEKKQKRIVEAQAKSERRKQESAKRYEERKAFLQKALIDQVRMLTLDETRQVKVFPIDPDIITSELLEGLDKAALDKLSDRISMHWIKPWRELSQRIDQLRNRG